MALELTPALLMSAYTQGVFPMADPDGELVWMSPDPRAVFDLDGFHVPRTLARLYRQRRFQLSIDRDFAAVIDACAGRPEGTWISADIRAAFVQLHQLGFAHSVEAWQEQTLAGGLYGVTVGGAFCGESMFHQVANASKIALVYLVERLRAGGFVLLDAQFMTDHLAQFNCRLISRAAYLRRLEQALQLDCRLTEPAAGA